MGTADALYESSIAGLDRIGRGKVRDIYSVDDDHLMIVTTDRLSAYDVVMPDPVPGKGQVLTHISNFWFKMMEDLIPNHLSDLKLDAVIDNEEALGPLKQRTIIARRLEPLPIEAVVRGYLIGSGWRDYQETGQVCGIELPPGLPQAARLPRPLFTPATKAEAGEHDENISFEVVQKLIGDELGEQVRDVSIRIYERAASGNLGNPQAEMASTANGIVPPARSLQSTTRVHDCKNPTINIRRTNNESARIPRTEKCPI